MFVIGTAGHVDHGKSLLVEALTGIDPDRLREEKVRGMTIDLGFAWLTLPSGRAVSIVDVPGHERFIKNMLAGAGGIDVALLVVAADDGVMPQTKEHLAILDLLGVRRGVVALTKCDLADEDWLSLIETDITDLLEPTTLAGSAVVRCSAVTRAGLTDLLAALDAALDGLSPKRNIARPRLPIDRVFTIAGFGTVVTGTLIDGVLATGDEIEVTPGGLHGRIRTLQNHRETVERALPGTRTAVNISGIAKDELRRGMVLARPGSIRPTLVLDARLHAAPYLAHPIRNGTQLTFHSGAAEANAKLRLLDADDLRDGQSAWAQLRLETPVALLRADRFVVRTANDTVGGGIVVDTSPKRHRRFSPDVIAALESFLSDAPEDRVLEAIGRQPLIDLRDLAAESQLDEATASAATLDLIERGLVMVVANDANQRLALQSWVSEHAIRAREIVAAYHAAHPLRRGIPLQELRERLALDADSFDALADQWDNLRLSSTTAALTAFQLALTPPQQAQIDAYLASLRNAADTQIDLGADLHAYLVESGAIVDAGNGVVFETESFDSMRQTVEHYIAEHSNITLAQARDLLGTGRKYAQALLEELDRRKITRRVGAARVLRIMPASERT